MLKGPLGLTFLAISSVALAGGGAASAAEGSRARKTTSRDLSLAVERFELANGMVALLSPDPSASSVLVDLTFKTGCTDDPPGKSGLAHLTEHIAMRGPTPDTDYIDILQRRRARNLNAFTAPGAMMFRVELPPEELPIALWVGADRVMTLPKVIDQRALDRERRVIATERIERILDVPFGEAELAIGASLFSVDHPLRTLGIGAPEELAAVTLDDVRAILEKRLVASNAILTVVGAFEPAVAKEWIQKTVARLPLVERPAPVTPPKNNMVTGIFQTRERLARRPRVTLIWRFDSLARDAFDSLELGAQLLSMFADGAFGTDVHARLYEQAGEHFFRLDVTLPHEKSMQAAQDEAEVYLRYLTMVDMPHEVFDSARVARDRVLLDTLDTLHGRAALLTAIESSFGDARIVDRHNERHWNFIRHDIQQIAWKTLVTGPKKTVVHARPKKMVQPKLEWDER